MRIDNKQLSKTVGEKVAEARRAQEMSREELADRMNISVVWLERVERGDSLPSVVTLAKLTVLLELDIGTVFRAVVENS